MLRLDDPLAFRPGIDGLLVSRGYAKGLLLPEVATMHELDAVGMLEATCWKAGLPANAWRDPRDRRVRLPDRAVRRARRSPDSSARRTRRLPSG